MMRSTRQTKFRLPNRGTLMSRRIDQRARRRLGAVCSGLMLVCLLSSCATPGTKVQVDRPGLTQLKRLGVTVTKGEEFSVVLARDQPLPPQLSRYANGLGAMLLAIADLAVYAVHTSSMSGIDARHASQLEPALGNFDVVKRFTEGVMRILPAEARSPAFVKVSTEDKSEFVSGGLDGTLEIKLKYWGLRRCGAVASTTFKPNPDDKLQVFFYITARIVPAAKTEPVWERQEFYVDNECRTLEERSAEGTLAADLSRAIDYLSGKMVNEIRFP